MQEVFEKIINKLREASYNHALCGRDMAIDEETAVQIVEDACEEYNDGWVPCSEYLPVGKEWEFTDVDGEVYHKHVLCQTDDSDVPMVVGFYQEGVWFVADTCDTIRVIAWQPLPQPYEPKEEER